MSEESPFVLHYFQLRARAEPLRMLMRYAGIKYTDQLYSKESWKIAKETMPPGKGAPGIATRPPGNRALPVLELPSGERLVETADIAKHLASGTILMPDDVAKAEEAQEIWESTMNFPFYWIQPMMSSYPQEISEAIIRGEKPENTMHGDIGDLPFSYSEILPRFKAWQGRLAGDFYGGDMPHYGDFAMYHQFDTFRGLEPEIAADLKELHAWATRMEALPSLAKYLAERPRPGHGPEVTVGDGSAECIGSAGSIYCKWRDPANRGDRSVGEQVSCKVRKLDVASAPRLCVDHLVWVVKSLSEGMDTLEKLTGVRPCIGGQHLGLGTHNALLSLGDGMYLEILAADPSQPSGARWLGIDSEQLPRLTTFCARRADGAGDIEKVIANANEITKYDGGAVKELSRQTPDGSELRWRLAAANHGLGFSKLPGGGLIPFLIDWTPCSMPHPSETSPAGCSLVALRAWHPDVASLANIMDGLGAGAIITGGISHGLEARLEASFNTPNGIVTLS